MMNHITEIIPDDIPEWANEAMAAGQLFRVCIDRATSKDDFLEDEGVLIELQDAIKAPDDIDSVKVTVEQGLLRRACMQIRRLRAELIRQQAPVSTGLKQ